MQGCGCDSNISDTRLKLRANIEKFGYTFLNVGGGNNNPGFTYTLGRCIKDQPEFLVIGNLNPHTVQNIIYDIVEKAEEKGELVLGERTDLANVRFFLKEVYSEDLFDNWIVQVPYVTNVSEENIRCVQTIWADINNLFPWEKGYNHEQFCQEVLPGKIVH